MQMQAAFKHRLGVLRSSLIKDKDKDDDLTLFLDVINREKERGTDLLLRPSHDFHAPLSTVRKSGGGGGVDDFLNSENDKNDYDWLLTPPGTPLFPSLEMETQKTVMSQLGAPAAHPTALKSRMASSWSEPTGRSNSVSKPPTSSPMLSSSSNGHRRPSSSVNPGSRPSTPTGRSTLSTASKSSRPATPSSRTTLPSTRTIVAAAKTTMTKPTVSASKTNTTVPAAKPTIPSRSSTPLSRSTARSSTPTSRPTLPQSRPTSRASTPTRRPSTPSSAPSISAPPVKTTSISKPAPVTSKQPVPSRGASPTVRSRPWKPSEMPGFSLDAPPNLRTTLPDRPLSATRGRPGAPSSRSSSVEPASIGRPKRQSCSPSRGRSSNGISHSTGSSMPAVSRGYSKVNDNVSPVLIGTKMVERVINMRKLVPPRLDDKNSPHSNLSGKSSSPDNSGFGRTLSKKSLDMAIRHMDIRRRVPGNLRPSMTNIPASSMYSVRSGPQRGRTVSVSDSPHATSSNASSEVSVNQNGICLDSSEIDDDNVSERGGQSAAQCTGRVNSSHFGESTPYI
ncbi:hypothetical protein RIF29_17531 [Crotalaria pallida]|uniref:Uncharacterized protein n=1 Tax=Crotalaria pallida TaxID=3830 RepID=A0AAN9FH70_CROPI